MFYKKNFAYIYENKHIIIFINSIIYIKNFKKQYYVQNSRDIDVKILLNYSCIA